MTEEELFKITGGKKLTFKQFVKKKAEYEEQQKNAARNDQGEVLRAGVCECGHKSFKHRLDNHQLIRICPNCSREKVV